MLPSGACEPMEFLVLVEISRPVHVDDAAWSRLLKSESARAAELVSAGVIKRLWRVPGRRANWGLWVADDATTLHEAIVSLPLFPYIDVTVNPLASHPSDSDQV